jgi:[DsrC]-trisulfide reductase subunit P
MFMFEKALVGSRRYWMWVGILLSLVLLGFLTYHHELEVGIGITGLSRDVPWGLYIGQFAFSVGVGASAIVVVLPYYLHDFKAFGKVTLLGEILGMVAVFMAMLFIFVSMGQPMRVMNVLLYPHPNSLIFWDLSVLSGYVLINAVITVTLLSAERNGLGPPKWIKPVIYLSIPWAISIHTVTAFIFSGLAGRSYFMTALLAPRFLASAFAAGSALLILLILLLRRLGKFDPNPQAVPKLTVILTYCMVVNVFFVLVEVFTAFYSRIPDERAHFKYLFAGLGGQHNIAVFEDLSVALALASLAVLLTPRWRSRSRLLPWACGFAFVSVWLDKGFAWIVSGFEPNLFGVVIPYRPTWPEWTIVLGIWALGAFLLTVFYRITLAVRAEKEPPSLPAYELVSATAGSQVHAVSTVDAPIGGAGTPTNGKGGSER